MGYRTTKSKIEVESNKTDNYTDFYYHFFRNILLVSIPSVIISVVILSSLHISADTPNNGSGSSTDTLSFNISSSCTLSSVVDENHNAELINGTYVDGIGQTTITTLCNDGNGYSVYAMGYSNNEEGNNKLVNTESSNFNIVSGTAESGNTSNWAMSLNNLKDDPSLTPPTITLDYDGIYGIVPDKWTKVASLPAKATDMIKGSSFTTTYAVYTSSSQYAGTYNGQVKYMLVHPSYKPAVYFMQDVANWKEFLSLEESIQAIDKRDGKSYWVTKLKDGNIWMTQNLDFDIDATTTLDSNTTDLNVAYNSSTGQYAEYSDGYTKDNGIIYYTPASTATTIDFTGTNVPGWQNSNTAPYTANKTDSTETGHTSLGNYYNWTAAIASNNSSSFSSDNTRAANSICPKGWRLPNASTTNNEYNEFGRLFYRAYGYDIVVSPSNGTDSVGYQADGYNAVQTDPLYFVLPGGINAGTLYGGGYYWSNTLDHSSAYFLHLYTNGVNLADKSLQKMVGLSVRCLAR